MTRKNEWETFFDAHAPVYMENVFTKNTIKEVDFILEELKLLPGSHILDVTLKHIQVYHHSRRIKIVYVHIFYLPIPDVSAFTVSFGMLSSSILEALFLSINSNICCIPIPTLNI